MVDTIVFLICAVICLTGAVGVIAARNPVHSALMLVMTLFGIAVLFIAQEAHFLAAVQVIVYAGAIVVLFLFVIMLLGVDVAADLRLGDLRGQKIAAAGFAVIALAVVGYLIVTVDSTRTGIQFQGGVIDETTPNIDLLAESLFDQYVYAFELTSVLLVVAVIGAVVLSRRQPALEIDSSKSTTGGEAN